jgi:hypothetical protein
MFIYIYVSLFLIFLYLNFKTKTHLEYFNNKNDINSLLKNTKNDMNDKNDINSLLKNTKNDITTNPNDWTIYNASKNKTNYILTKKNDKSIIYKVDIKNENGKMLFTVNDKNNKYIGTRVSTGIHPLSTFGKFENTVVNIDYKKGNKRININIGNNETLITGYGGFSNSITHSAPWDTVIPIVYMDGGTCIGLMDYVENKNIKSSTYLPFEIIVSNKNEKYLPIFFTVYVMIQEYIGSLNS